MRDPNRWPSILRSVNRGRLDDDSLREVEAILEETEREFTQRAEQVQARKIEEN